MTAPSSVLSKTFENYIMARERQEKIAKEKIEHLNKLAIDKVKHRKNAEKQMKELRTTDKAKQETKRHRQLEALQHKETQVKQYLENAKEQQVKYEQDLKDRQSKKLMHEREQSEHNFKQALSKFHQTTRFEGKTFLTESPDARSQASRTQGNFFGSRSMFKSNLNPMEDKLIEEDLKNFHSKIEKGFFNSISEKQKRVQHLREMSQKKPELEDLYKVKEETQFQVWHDYVLRQTDKQKKIKKNEKKVKEEQMANMMKTKEHFESVQHNIQVVKDQQRDRINTLNQKAQQRLEQVNDNDERRNLRSLKQREIDHLRYLDNVENQETIKARKFRENCQIVEKHLALSILNHERKQYLQNFNDKYRSRMAKERIMLKQQHGNLSPFLEATNKHMALHTFAPDLVKWTRKDFEKLFKEEKKED